MVTMVMKLSKISGFITNKLQQHSVHPGTATICKLLFYKQQFYNKMTATQAQNKACVTTGVNSRGVQGQA